ncbi:Elongation of very long chain fatty acids protein [Blattella germanica]|nr:Elongation of very long chain fatty acids protein [Blattella germanica]
MATLINETFNAFHHVFHELPDRRTDDWFLMGSIWMPISISAIYVYFVKYWGPRFMKNREPFKLDHIIAIYNFIQMVWCFELFYDGYTLEWGTKYRLFGEPVNYTNDPEALRIASGIWQYYILKIIDLLDTVFFVLRKKDRQVTFLHVYHHAGMVIIAWCVARYVPGGHTTLVGATNCFVHVFMYGYYLLAVLWPEMKNNTWVKKHITHLQMVREDIRMKSNLK